MSDFSASDSAFMARALQLAVRGRFSVQPNPVVGCVLVRDGKIIGEGWHEQAGSAHAEVNAIANSVSANSATAYVTLEPCAHHGKTPPCATALIEAGVSEVVFAVEDPNRESGSGSDVLESAGIKVRSGLMLEDAKALNAGFFQRVLSGRPRVRVKIAASLDGAIAMSNGESQWITGQAARDDVQRQRAESGAVMSGVGTILADDPSFNIRDESLETKGRQPIRVVLDSKLRMPLSSGMLCLPGETIVFCVDDAGRAPLEDAGAEIVKVRDDNGRVDIAAVLDDLGAREVNDLLVEAGPTLSGALLAGGHVDELVIYQAPHIMGSETRPMFHTPTWGSLADRVTLQYTDVRILDFQVNCIILSSKIVRPSPKYFAGKL